MQVSEKNSGVPSDDVMGVHIGGGGGRGVEALSYFIYIYYLFHRETVLQQHFAVLTSTLLVVVYNLHNVLYCIYVYRSGCNNIFIFISYYYYV